MENSLKVEEQPEEVADNWEEFLDEISDEEKKEKEEKEKAAAAAQAAALKRRGAKKKKQNALFDFGSDSEGQYEDAVEGDDEEIDALTEKMRAQKLVEESDMAIAADLFGECERPQIITKTNTNVTTPKKKKDISLAASKDPFDFFPLGNLKEIEFFANYFCDAIKKVNVKSIAWLRLLEVILRDTSPKMEFKDLTTLGNKISSYIQHKRNLVTANKTNVKSGRNPLLLTPLNNLKEIEAFAEKLAAKARESQAKSIAWLRLFDLILVEVAPRMDAKDLTTLGVKLSSSLQQKFISKKEALDNKRKPNDKGNLSKNYRDEMDILYGDLSEAEEEDEDSLDEDYDEFIKGN